MAIISKFAPAGLTSADTTYEATTRGYPASFTNIGITKTKVYENTFSLAAVTTGPAQRAGTAVTVADSVQLFTIPKNHVLVSARLEVIVADTTAGLTVATVKLNDGATDIVAATNAFVTGTIGTSVTPKYYTADTVLSLLPVTLTGAANLTNSAFRIVVTLLDATTGDDATRVLG